MNGGMEHHCKSNGHDCMNYNICNAIVMMGTNASVLENLSKVFQIFLVYQRSEGSIIVTQIFCDNYTKIMSSSNDSLEAMVLYIVIELGGKQNIAGSIYTKIKTLDY
jgi:hypothetical protein